METRTIIAIHGIGMVGGALKRYFTEQNRQVVSFDPPKGLESDLSEAGIHFLCVPTPFDQDGAGFSRSYLEQAFSNIQRARGDAETTVVIKSTSLPGTTEHFQKQYPAYAVLFNPEFLTEKDADKDLREPDRQIIGIVHESHIDNAQKIISLLPKAPYEKIMQAKEAELVKYFGNAFLALKVMYGNFFYDLCQKHGVDYETVKNAAIEDRRIGKTHLDVHDAGYRGYGGTCFPKDVRALLQQANELGVQANILQAAEDWNNKLRGL